MIQFLIIATILSFNIFSDLPKVGEVLNNEKYADCLLSIPIDYKNIDQNFEESKKYADVEIVLVTTKAKGKIKSLERGYIRNLERNGRKHVFFEPTESVNSIQKIAKFPLFNAKGTFCFRAECFDEK